MLLFVGVASDDVDGDDIIYLTLSLYLSHLLFSTLLYFLLTFGKLGRIYLYLYICGILSHISNNNKRERREEIRKEENVVDRYISRSTRNISKQNSKISKKVGASCVCQHVYHRSERGGDPSDKKFVLYRRRNSDIK